MSRRDVTEILERLYLDHRTSLADKACAFLDAVQANSSFKNHPCHAAICIDIAAQRLTIEISRQALIRLSATSAPVYTSILQTLDRFLPGGSKRGISTGDDGQGGRGSESTSDANLMGNSQHAKLCASLTRTSLTYLRQMAVQYGSMELYEVVLECLEQFFPSWFLTLPPAQQLQMNYSDPKWVGAAFWLCAMAKGMNATPEEIAGKTTDKPKKIGGRGGKELKELTMTAVEHKVQQKDLETTIRLIEQYTQSYLVSLKKVKGGNTSTVSAPSTPRKRKTSSTSGDFGVDIVIPTRGGTEAQKLLQLKQKQQQQSAASSNPFMDSTESGSTVNPDNWELRRARTTREPAAGATVTTTQGRSTKRTISNVSQMSLVSDGEDEEGSKQSTAVARPSRPSKRAKVESTAEDSQSSSTAAISSSGIMKPKKGSVRKDLQTTAANQRGRRRTGGVYNMIPRLRYQDTKAYSHYQEWKENMRTRLQSAV